MIDRRPVLLSCAAILSLFASSCIGVIDPFDPMVGEALSERCANQDSDPDTEVSFSMHVLPVLKKQGVPVGCACHQPSDPNPIGFEQAGLDLSSYLALMRGGNNSKSNIVVPTQPCDSILWQKISAGPPFGARMPFNGPPFLDDDTRRMFSDWIAEGARDN